MTTSSASESPCIFCDKHTLEETNILAENEFCYAHLDKYPVSKGHLEIIPKKHVVSLFELTDAELTQMFSLLKIAKEVIQQEHQPDGYNIGINEGEAAGRTIHHLHIHLIPRYTGDVENPRGGVRHVIPGKGNY